MLKVGARCWYDLSITPFGIYKIVLDSRSDVTYMQARRLGLKKLLDIEKGYDRFIKLINKN